jgi:hypothetical protein
MIGDWLHDDTSVQTMTEFVEKVYARKNLQGFGGDRRFIPSQHAQKLFSKLRSSIAGVYAWRVGNQVTAAGEIGKAENRAEQQRMLKEADFAFRQAFAICPYSPEAVFRYINLLLLAGRADDSLLVANAALKVEPDNKQMQNLVKELERIKAQQKN